MLYIIIRITSIIARQFYLPNPFECFDDYAILINWITEPIIQYVTFKFVGLMGYQSGSAPVLGSLLYLVVYSIIVGILMLLSIFSFAWWWIITVIVIFVILIIGIKHLGRRIFYGETR